MKTAIMLSGHKVAEISAGKIEAIDYSRSTELTKKNQKNRDFTQKTLYFVAKHTTTKKIFAYD
jgi:hypothetical protein